MARVEELKNYVFVIGSNLSIKIPKSLIQRILEHRITKVTTIETRGYKIVFSPESEPMIFSK